MCSLVIPIQVESGRGTKERRGDNTAQLVKRGSRSKLKCYQIQIKLDTEPLSDTSTDLTSFKTKPQFLKRRSVPKLGSDSDRSEKTVIVNSDIVKHVKLGQGANSVPGVLTRRQSSGKDLLGLAKPSTGATRALTRRESGGRQDLLGLDQRRNSCGKERRGSLRLSTKSLVELETEKTSCVARLSAITLDQCTTEYQRSALLCHNKYRVRHGVSLLQLDSQLCSHAQQYADTLAATDTFQHSNDPLYGENLYWSWSSDPAWSLPGEEAVDSWYQERKGYNYDQEPQDSESGHFTQLVWAGSRLLGVGLAKSATTGKYITVMKYHPPGNYLGMYRENVFRPAICGGKKILDL